RVSHLGGHGKNRRASGSDALSIRGDDHLSPLQGSPQARRRQLAPRRQQSHLAEADRSELTSALSLWERPPGGGRCSIVSRYSAALPGRPKYLLLIPIITYSIQGILSPAP